MQIYLAEFISSTNPDYPTDLATYPAHNIWMARAQANVIAHERNKLALNQVKVFSVVEDVTYDCYICVPVDKIAAVWMAESLVDADYVPMCEPHKSFAESLSPNRQFYVV